MRTITWYTKSAEYHIGTMRRPPIEEARRKVLPELADKLLIGVDDGTDWWADRRDVKSAGHDNGRKSIGFVLGAATIVYPLDADMEQRIRATQTEREQREADRERRDTERARSTPAPRIGGGSRGPCPRCGTYCCGDCVAAEMS